MIHSFIKPAPKPYFSLFTKLWMFFIIAVVLLMSMFDFFVLYKINSFKSDTKDLITKQKVLEKKIETNDEMVGFILRQKGFAEEIYSSNVILKDSMKNLFDLVPDQITLTKVLMEKNSLILYGKTPSKDSFNFLLASPLRSIFHVSNTVFYLNEQGWYRFVSTNKIIDSDGFNE